MMELERLLDQIDLMRLAEEAGARLGQRGDKRCAFPLHQDHGVDHEKPSR